MHVPLPDECPVVHRQWQALISVPPPVGYAYVHHASNIRNVSTSSRHPPEPQCSYDPIEGLAIAPDVDPTEKIRILEEQICMSANHYTLIGLSLTKPFSTTQKPAQPDTPANLGLCVTTGALSSARVQPCVTRKWALSRGKPD